MESDSERDIESFVLDHIRTIRPTTEWQPNVHRSLSRLREQRAARAARKRRRAFIGFGTAIAGLLFMALPETRVSAERWFTVCLRVSGISNEVLPRNVSLSNPSSTFIQPRDRVMAPDFVLNDASGLSVRLSESRGRVILLNFWATQCNLCSTQISWFIDFQNRWRNRGFSTVGVLMEQGSGDAVKAFVDEKHVNYHVLIGNDQVAGMYGGLKVLPATMIIDRIGRIAAVHLGMCTKDEYEADITNILNER
jgi:peroxiredoxin